MTNSLIALTPQERATFNVYRETHRNEAATALALRISIPALREMLKTIDAKLDAQLMSMMPVALKKGQHALRTQVSAG